MLKIGVLGAGHLGRIHINCCIQSEKLELVGLYDSNPEIAKKVSEEFDIPALDSIEALIEKVDIVDIVTPTMSHFACAIQALKAFKHVFIEKPIVNTPDEARQLLSLDQES